MATAGGKDTQIVIKISAGNEKWQQKRQNAKRHLLTELQVWFFMAKSEKEVSDESAWGDRRDSRARKT